MTLRGESGHGMRPYKRVAGKRQDHSEEKAVPRHRTPKAAGKDSTKGVGEDFKLAFSSLKGVLGKYAKGLSVKTSTAKEYTLVTKSPSPFPQHKGQPMFFASVRLGKAYVSFHLLPLYMNPKLASKMPPALKKRMQGKACFQFKKEPEAEIREDLDCLIAVSIEDWDKRKWL